VKAPPVVAPRAITAIEYVTGVSNISPATIPIVLGTPTAWGDTLVLEVFCGISGFRPWAISDDHNQKYTLITDIQQIGTHGYFGFFLLMSSVAGVQTITVTENASQDNRGGVIVGHYSGLNGIDQTPAMTANAGGASWASAAITTVYANELIVGGCYAYTQNPVTIASPFTQQATLASSGNFDGSNGNGMVYGDYIVSSIQTGLTATGTQPVATANGGISIMSLVSGVSSSFGVRQEERLYPKRFMRPKTRTY
jgi:hypothetical protein